MRVISQKARIAAWPFVGILGGMGSLAGVDFARKLVECAARSHEISCDQDQVPFVLWSDPRVPDRTDAAFDPKAPDPLPAMKSCVIALNGIGVDVIAITCNTAHHWHSALAATSSAPILHIADAAVSSLRASFDARRVGVIGGSALIRLGIYQNKLEEAGYIPVVPSERELDQVVMPAIRLAKRARMDEAALGISVALDSLLRQGADVILLGCTELPLVIESENLHVAVPILDPAEALAEACLKSAKLIVATPLISGQRVDTDYFHGAVPR